jgi:hypothetical protein
MNSLTTSGPRAAQLFSQRGQSVLAHGSKSIIWDILSNLWHKETNQYGHVSVGVAEHALLHDSLLDYINRNIRLTSNYLTYTDGSMASNKFRKAAPHFLNRHQPGQARGTTAYCHDKWDGCSAAIEHLSWAFMEPARVFYLEGHNMVSLSLKPHCVLVQWLSMLMLVILAP